MAHGLFFIGALCVVGYSLFVTESKQSQRDGFAYV